MILFFVKQNEDRTTPSFTANQRLAIILVSFSEFLSYVIFSVPLSFSIVLFPRSVSVFSFMPFGL